MLCGVVADDDFIIPRLVAQEGLWVLAETFLAGSGDIERGVFKAGHFVTV